jgi:ribonuclease HI
MIWRVGNGRKIKIWGDKWLPSPTTYAIQSPVHILNSEARVCDLIDPDLQWWNIPLIKEVFKEEEVEKICSLAICPRTQEDQTVWVGNKNGEFSVQSAYHLAIEICSREESGCSNTDSLTPLWKQIWRINVPRVVKLFLWQACNNILPTKEKLFKRKITDDPLCPVCCREVETVGHALWSCSAARDVWLESNVCIQKSCSEEDAFCNILLNLCDRLKIKDWEQVGGIARQIWLRRNKLVFEGEFTHPKIVYQCAVDQLEFHRQVSQGDSGQINGETQSEVEKWKPPPRGTVKLNWDAAIDMKTRMMGVGVVDQDHAGGVIATQCSTRMYVCDPAMAEAVAVWTAVGLVGQLGFSNFILEGDSLVVVKALQREERNWANYGPILEETKELLKGGHSWEIRHVRRSANGVAHRIAKMAISLNVNQLWLTTIPPCIRDIVLAEAFDNE